MECCWCLCLQSSFKGASYFGASVHNYIGLQMLRNFVIKIVRSNYYEPKQNEQFENFDLLLQFIYIFAFLLTGILIFRGIEKEMRKLIQWSATLFLLVELTTLITVMFLWSDNLEVFVFKIAEHCLYTLMYAVALFLYCRKLWYEDSLWKI